MDIKGFFNDVIKQDKNALIQYFDKDAVILWPCTNEQFTVEEYIKANCEYPGKWHGNIEHLYNNVDNIVLVANVYSDDNKVSCHVVSFIDIENDKIVKLIEYWADDTVIPNWRKEMNIGKNIY